MIAREPPTVAFEEPAGKIELLVHIVTRRE